MQFISQYSLNYGRGGMSLIDPWLEFHQRK